MAVVAPAQNYSDSEGLELKWVGLDGGVANPGGTCHLNRLRINNSHLSVTGWEPIHLHWLHFIQMVDYQKLVGFALGDGTHAAQQRRTRRARLALSRNQCISRCKLFNQKLQDPVACIAQTCPPVQQTDAGVLRKRNAPLWNFGTSSQLRLAQNLGISNFKNPRWENGTPVLSQYLLTHSSCSAELFNTTNTDDVYSTPASTPKGAKVANT